MTARPASPGGSLNQSRSPKRVKLELSETELDVDYNNDTQDIVDEDHCSICLQHVVDRTILPGCAHEFCFECILVWAEQSRRCPLCSQVIYDYLIHHIRSKYDYQKYYLTPLRTTPPPLQPSASSQQRRPRRREHRWGRPRRDTEDREQADELERAIARRRWIYEHGLYAKHVASNSFTRYRPYPTPAQFSASQDLISRTTMFLRRELRVWINLDVEFLTTFILSLMKSIDIRSESAVKLLSEFLDMDVDINAEQDRGSRRNAEHFAHELYCYIRSPYRDLSIYDSVVQYDTPVDVPAPIEFERSRRWRPSRSRSRQRSRSRSRSPSHRRDLSPSDYSRPRTRSKSASPSRRKSYQKPNDRRKRTSRRNNSSRRNRSRSHSHGRDRRQRSRSHDRYESRHGDRETRYSRGTSVYNDKGKEREQSREQMPTPARSLSPQAVIADAVTAASGEIKQEADTSHRLGGSGPSASNSFHATSSIGQASINVDDVAPAVPKTKPRSARNRGLLESVQAHLNGGRSTVQRRIDVTKPANLKDNGKDTSTCLVAEPRPSLFTRLSDRDVTISPWSETQDAQLAQEADMKSQRPRLSAPQIMARTRARLAKLKDEPIADVSSTVPDSNSGGVNIIRGACEATRVASTDDDDIRTRLLNRLEEERRRIPQGAAVLPDPARSAGVDLGVGLDSQAAEAKLRMQAQVRVRLAAAKRAAGGHSESAGSSAMMDTDKVKEDVAFVQREESLRARLKERKV